MVVLLIKLVVLAAQEQVVVEVEVDLEQALVLVVVPQEDMLDLLVHVVKLLVLVVDLVLQHQAQLVVQELPAQSQARA